MEEEHMNNSGGKAGKIDTIIHSKEGAEIERACTVICIHVKVKVFIYYSRDIVALASGRE